MYKRHWEEFPVGPEGIGPNELRVTLSRKGEIMIGLRAFEKMGCPEAAVLLYDRRDRVIGVVAADPKVENSFPLKTKSRTRYRILRASIFCRHYGIRFERTVAFNKPFVDEDGVLVLDLKNIRGVGKLTPKIAIRKRAGELELLR